RASLITALRRAVAVAASGPHLGCIWSASGPHLGRIWAASGPHLGRIWAASGLHLGARWPSLRGGAAALAGMPSSACLTPIRAVCSFRITKRAVPWEGLDRRQIIWLESVRRIAFPTSPPVIWPDPLRGTLIVTSPS